MVFLKVAACGVNKVVFVRVLLADYPCASLYVMITSPPFSAVIIPSAAKKYIIRYTAMDFSILAACGTGW